MKAAITRVDWFARALAGSVHWWRRGHTGPRIAATNLGHNLHKASRPRAAVSPVHLVSKESYAGPALCLCVCMSTRRHASRFVSVYPHAKHYSFSTKSERLRTRCNTSSTSPIIRTHPNAPEQAPTCPHVHTHTHAHAQTPLPRRGSRQPQRARNEPDRPAEAERTENPSAGGHDGVCTSLRVCVFGVSLPSRPLIWYGCRRRHELTYRKGRV